MSTLFLTLVCIVAAGVAAAVQQGEPSSLIMLMARYLLFYRKLKLLFPLVAVLPVAGGGAEAGRSAADVEGINGEFQQIPLSFQLHLASKSAIYSFVLAFYWSLRDLWSKVFRIN